MTPVRTHRAERLRQDRGLYTAVMVVAAFVAGIALPTAWPLAGIALVVVGGCAHSAWSTVEDELAEARRGWRPGVGLHVIDRPREEHR